LAINGGGADIDGNGVVPLAGIAGLDIDDLVFSSFHYGPGEGGRYLEIGFSQNIGKLPNHGERNHQPMFVVTLLEKADEAAGIRKVVARGGDRQLEIPLFHRRYKQASILQIIQIDLPDFSRMTGGVGVVQDAGIKLRLDRNAHCQIALDPGEARQPVALVQVFLAQCFRGPPFHRSGFDDHPALPALSFASAGSIHVDPGFHGSLQQGFAIGKHGLPVSGQEGNPMHSHGVMFPLVTGKVSTNSPGPWKSQKDSVLPIVDIWFASLVLSL